MKFFTILVLLVAFATSTFAQTWYTNPANGHRYAEIPIFTHWVGAEAAAVNLGGHLVTINDVAENSWVKLTFNLHGGTDQWCWIGLYETDYAARNWHWVSGEPLTYTNWGSGEPSGPGAEHWVAMDGDGWWRDLASNWPPPARQTAVVEVVPESATVGILVVGLLAAIKKRRS